MDAYISKPYRFENVMSVLHSLTEKHPRPANRFEGIDIPDCDPDTLKKIVELFDDGIRAQMPALKEAMIRNEFQLAGTILHKLKGTLSNFGQNSAFDAAGELESILGKNTGQEQTQVYDLLSREVQNLSGCLKEKIHENLAC